MFRRLLGFIMFLIGFGGIALSVAGVLVSNALFDSIGAGIHQGLTLVSSSLDTTEQALLLSKTTMGQVNDGLDTVETTANDLAKTISQTRPLVDQVSQIASHDVPGSLEAVQGTLPNVAEVAGAIDTTLRTLNDFRIDQTILGVPVHYDLGINYQPAEPFDVTVNQIGDSLTGLPQRLRTLEVYLNVSNDNLSTISQDILRISDDLDQINGGLAEVQPLLDDTIRIVGQLKVDVLRAQHGVDRQMLQLKQVLLVIFVWIGLTQVAPIYLGWELLTGWKPWRRRRLAESPPPEDAGPALEKEGETAPAGQE